MAKIKWGMIVTDGRNKLGGQVFSKNRAGSYIRTKVTPVNPKTALQMASRQLLGALSSAWSSLTTSQRDAWNSAVDDWQKTDIFGDLRKPTGKNLFTGLNKNRIATGGVVQNTPPAKVEIPVIDVFRPEFTIQSEKLALGTENVPAGMVLQVMATPPMSQGTSFAKNQLRVIGHLSEGAENPATTWNDYIARFGVPALGQNIQVAVRYIATTGQAGVQLIKKAGIQQA